MTLAPPTDPSPPDLDPTVAKPTVVIGAGPAGLMAADVLSAAGRTVVIYERMPSPARKFLLAGRGGLNITHSEPSERFLARYREAADWLAPAIAAFPPDRLRDWCAELGQPTFVGSSGRVFPQAFKASPLLRAWLRRLGQQGVVLRPRHEWRGWDADGRLLIAGPDGQLIAQPAAATVLALGGASWPRLGSDGHWTEPLAAAGVALTPLAPADCGVHVAWTPRLIEGFAGTPLKRIALSLGDTTVKGEAVVTAAGLEGGAVYALSADIRAALARGERPILRIDLRPDLDGPALAARLARTGARASLGNALRKAGLPPVARALLHEADHHAADHRPGPSRDDPTALATRIKAVPVTVTGLAGLDRAISTAGGVARTAVDADFMLTARPGTFVAGEMLDWEAPTGGYLLQATLATGAAAAHGALRWLTCPH